VKIEPATNISLVKGDEDKRLYAELLRIINHSDINCLRVEYPMLWEFQSRLLSEVRL